MAFSSVNIESISMSLEGVVVGVADRCVPFLTNNLTGMSIVDPQDAFDELHEEQVASRYCDDMDWEETSQVTIPFIPAKFNPFLGAEAASKPVNPFVTAKVNPCLDAKAVSKPANPVNPFLSQPAVSSLPVEMDIDEWSINDQTNANAQPARKRDNRNNQPNNQRQSNGRGNSNSTSHKPNGGAAGFLGNHKVSKSAEARQDNNNSSSETRRGGNNKNNNSSRQRSNNGNKNHSQRQ